MTRALALTIAMATCLLLAACGSTKPIPDTPPVRGALFGAYVDPPLYTEKERIQAFERFEHEIGRRLDVFHDFHTWEDPFPGEADMHFARRGPLVLLSWAGTDTRAITSGVYDDLIRQRAQEVKALDRPMLLEWRWEMNRPNLRAEIHSPADYVAAWRHIHRIFDQEHVRHLGWVWCPLADARADPDFGAYYPGDDEVDWVCANGYARTETQTFADVFTPFLTWAKAIHKPVIIGEFGRQVGTPGTRAGWLEAARAYIKQHSQIKAVVYFESARGASGRYDVASEPAALDAFRAWGHDDYFRR